MVKLDQKHRKILMIILERDAMQSSEIHTELVSRTGEDLSLVTIKRTLYDMVRGGAIVMAGSGRSTSYSISILGRIFAEVDANAYCSIEPDRRYGISRYNFDLLSALPSDI